MTYSMSYLLSLLPWGPGRPVLTRATLSNRTVTCLFKINYIVLHGALLQCALPLLELGHLLFFYILKQHRPKQSGKASNLFRSTPWGNYPIAIWSKSCQIKSVPPSSSISSQPSLWLSSLRRLECLPLSLEEMLIRDLDKFDFPLVKSHNKIISCVSL